MCFVYFGTVYTSFKQIQNASYFYHSEGANIHIELADDLSEATTVVLQQNLT